MFLGDGVLDEMQTWANGPYGPKIWGRYGFADSLNLENDWFDHDVIGITLGALYLSVANTHTDATIWKVFHSIPAVQGALSLIKH